MEEHLVGLHNYMRRDNMNYSMESVFNAAMRFKQLMNIIRPIINRLNEEAKQYVVDDYQILFEYDNEGCIYAYFPFIYNCWAFGKKDYRVDITNSDGSKTDGFMNVFGRHSNFAVKSSSFYVEVSIDEIIKDMENDEPINEETVCYKLYKIITNNLLCIET